MTDKKREMRLSDQVIGQVRELLQLSLLTGTNLVDLLRSVRVEESKVSEGVLLLSEEYVTGWNQMSEKFHEQASEKSKKMSETLADEDEEDPGFKLAEN